MEAFRPRPAVDPDSAPYWEAAAREQLLIQRCRACGRHQFYPRQHCRFCWATDIEWHEASGRGSVYSFSVVNREVEPGFEPPYVIALVDLEEGVRMPTNIVGGAAMEVQVGSEVEVVFIAVDEERKIPGFRLVAPGTQGEGVR